MNKWVLHDNSTALLLRQIIIALMTGEFGLIQAGIQDFVVLTWDITR